MLSRRTTACIRGGCTTGSENKISSEWSTATPRVLSRGISRRLIRGRTVSAARLPLKISPGDALSIRFPALSEIPRAHTRYVAGLSRGAVSRRVTTVDCILSREERRIGMPACVTVSWIVNSALVNDAESIGSLNRTFKR